MRRLIFCDRSPSKENSFTEEPCRSKRHCKPQKTSGTDANIAREMMREIQRCFVGGPPDNDSTQQRLTSPRADLDAPRSLAGKLTIEATEKGNECESASGSVPRRMGTLHHNWEYSSGNGCKIRERRQYDLATDAHRSSREKRRKTCLQIPS